MIDVSKKETAVEKIERAVRAAKTMHEIDEVQQVYVSIPNNNGRFYEASGTPEDIRDSLYEQFGINNNEQE
jgi:hypothetical protein